MFEDAKANPFLKPLKASNETNSGKVITAEENILNEKQKKLDEKEKDLNEKQNKMNEKEKELNEKQKELEKTLDSGILELMKNLTLGDIIYKKK